jgi:hypothetical protein
MLCVWWWWGQRSLDCREADAGKAAIRNLIAKVGIPLSECKQPWAHMSYSARVTVQKKLAQLAATVTIARPEFQSFTRQVGFDMPIACADVALAITALLEAGGDAGQVAAAAFASEAAAVAASAGLTAEQASSLAIASRDPGSGDSAWETAFFTAFQALASSQTGKELLNRGILLAQQQLRGIARLTPRLVSASSGRSFAGIVNVVSGHGCRAVRCPADDDGPRRDDWMT